MSGDVRFPERPWPENAMPTPAQWVEWFNLCTHEARLVLAERVISDSETASRCFLMNHEDGIRHLRAQVDRLALAHPSTDPDG